MISEEAWSFRSRASIAFTRSRHKLGLREAYLRWLRLTKRAQERERYTALSEVVGATRMRQKVFLAWKEVLAESKNERVMGKYIAWRNWCDNIKFQKFFQRAAYLTDKLDDERNQKLKKTVFDALKFNKFNSRLEKASTELAEERPLR